MPSFKKIFIALMVIIFSENSNAALITITGSDVSFTYDNSLVGLFGTPTVSGDTLIFSPTTFSASRENTLGTVYANSSVNIIITSLYGDSIINLALKESGDYTKDGPTAFITAKGKLTATDVTNTLTFISNFQTPVLAQATVRWASRSLGS